MDFGKFQKEMWYDVVDLDITVDFEVRIFYVSPFACEIAKLPLQDKW